EGSALRTAIKERCPQCEEPVALKWSGANNVYARAAAAERLAQLIRDNSGNRHIVITHSHAGNIVVKALGQQAVADSVAGVVCLNTPFFTLLRKDSQNLAEFLFVGSCMFLGFAFWYPFFVRRQLPFWGIWPALALVLLFAAFKYLEFKKVQGWIQSRWSRYQQQFPQPHLKSVPFLCLNAGADEALAVLAVADGVGNLPTLFLSRYFAGPLLMQIIAVLLLLHKIGAAAGVFRLAWLGPLLVLFKLPDLNGLGFHFQPQWWFVASMFEIFGLAALYSAACLVALSLMAVVFGTLSRASMGSWREPLLPLFAHHLISLTPVGCERVEFRQYDDVAVDETPLHSALYSNPKVIDHIVEWINAEGINTGRGK
ncbi:MAG: hypothetical protein ABIO24_00285, partial [Saprospiraceae bacterium]